MKAMEKVKAAKNPGDMLEAWDENNSITCTKTMVGKAIDLAISRQQCTIY